MTTKEALKEYDPLLKDDRYDSDVDEVLDEWVSEYSEVVRILLREYFDRHGLPSQIAVRCVLIEWERWELNLMIDYLRKSN